MFGFSTNGYTLLSLSRVYYPFDISTTKWDLLLTLQLKYKYHALNENMIIQFYIG